MGHAGARENNPDCEPRCGRDHVMRAHADTNPTNMNMNMNMNMSMNMSMNMNAIVDSLCRFRHCTPIHLR